MQFRDPNSHKPKVGRMRHYRSLREFIELARQRQEVQDVLGASAELELACINELVAENKGSLLLFDSIPGFAQGFRVATGVLTNHNRTCLALGIPAETRPLEIVKFWKELNREVKPVKPEFHSTAPVKQHRQQGSDVNVLGFPAPHWHPKDGGKYIGTGGLVVVRDPDEGWVNCAINRVMVVSKNEVAMQVGNAGQNATIIRKYRERNLPCPVAICLSPEPILMLAGGYKVPWGVSEYEFAGGLRNEPIHLTEGPETGLPIPLNPEIVLEGVIEPGASCDEGPFGEWTGYIAGSYKKEGGFPILVKVSSVLHCSDPILLGVRPLKPPTPWYTSAPISNASAIWGQLESGGQRGIKGVWTHVLESFGAIWTVVAIDQQYKGHSREVGIATTTCPGVNGWGAFVVVVDADVDITNINDVLWAMAMRCEISKDVMQVDGIRSSALFPWINRNVDSAGTKTGGTYLGSRMIFDACKEFERRNAYPAINVFDDEYRKQVLQRWSAVIEPK